MGIEVTTLPWYRMTTLQCGMGDALLVRCGTVNEIREAAKKYPDMHILGGGSNTVGSDKDNITVLRLKCPGNPVEQTGDDKSGLFRIHAAASLAEVVLHLARLGRGGLAALAGIPGTVGGAAAMNAGANGREIAEFITGMEGISLQNGQPWRWQPEHGGFAYRTSPRPSRVAITAITLQLPTVNPEAEINAIMEERKRRAKVTPPGRSAGSVFRNPADAPPAGKLLEAAGCKGLTQGNLSVSAQHANWIVNLTAEAARAADADSLVKIMQEKVLAHSGIKLQCEWKFLP